MKHILAVVLLCSAGSVRAWDYEGHRLINQLALATLPTNFPAFALTEAARERIAFLSGEPDRWRNSIDHPFAHAHKPDHFLDLEDLAEHGLDAKSLSPFRYEFAGHLALARSAHPTNFPPIDETKDLDKNRALLGFLPWAIAEHSAKLKSSFSYLRTFESADGVRPDEIANARENILYVMGVMGHFIGDAAQPLHTTRHYNGWVGSNPQGYSTSKTFHSWIDGGYPNHLKLRLADLRPKLRSARALLAAGAPASQTNFFSVAMDYLIAQHRQVIPLYELEKQRKLSSREEPGAESRAFFEKQFLAAAQLLGDIWFTAWDQAPPDTFLKGQLARRKLAEEKARAAAEPVKKP